MVCTCGGVMCNCDMENLTILLTVTLSRIAFGMLSQIIIGRESAGNIMRDPTFYGVWLWSVIVIITSQPRYIGGQFLQCLPCYEVIAIYRIATLIFLGANSLTWPICDMWFVKFGCQWHLFVPSVQVKPELWLGLTSSYELGFECHSHRWN